MYPQFEEDRKLVSCVPTDRQLAVEEMEFYAFAHFTVNTFTDKEWGDGTEDEAVFNPTELNANQWVSALKSAGIKGLILTCKHHDGFCLWPSKYTEHCVRNSPFRAGKGDVVKEVSDACRRGGIRFGIYLSPWDRNSKLYGQGKPYDDFFCDQLTELLTGYGDIFTVWFDGACGEGPNGKKQVYDYERYYALIRKLMPNAAISISGPDIRWCGNEAGETRESEWSVLPTGFDGPEGKNKLIEDTQRDLGSRSFLKGATGLAWRPSETDTSIRPGWFYHEREDTQVRSADTLFDIYCRTVGGNSTLLLNIPPDRRGLFPDVDVESLRALGDKIRSTFAHNLAEKATITLDREGAEGSCADDVRTDSYDTSFRTEEGINALTLTFGFEKPETVSTMVIKENIRYSQRIEKFLIEAKEKDGTYRTLYAGTTVGYQKIARFDEVTTDELRFRITDSRVCPVISFVGIY